MMARLYAWSLLLATFTAFAATALAADITLTVGGILNTVPFDANYQEGQLWEMQYFKEAVQEMGGLPLRSGDRVFFDFQLEEAMIFDVAALTAITEAQCANGVRIYMGPLFTDDALVQADILSRCVSDANQVIMLQPSANGNALYDCPQDGWDQPEYFPCTAPGARRFPSLWTFLPPLEDTVESLINPFLSYDVSTLGMILLQTSANADAAEVAQRVAKDNGVELLPVEWITFFAEDINATLAQLFGGLMRLREADPDVLISITNACDTMAAVEQMGWAPNGLAETSCVPILAEPVDARYIVHDVNWDPRLRGTSYVEDPNVIPSFFYDGDRPAPAVFLERMLEFSDGAYSPGSTGGSAMTGGLIIANAIWRTGSLDSMPLINQFMGQTSMTGMWGQVQFGPRGKMTGRSCATISSQLSREGIYELVEPVSSRTAKLVYPMPDYDSRENSQSYMDSGSEIAVAVVAAVCMLVSLCFALNILAHWSKGVWVAAQRTFLLVVLVASIMVYAIGFTWTLYATTATCTSTVWLLTVGGCLILAALSAKTWRVFRVFLNKKLVEVRLSDLYIAGVVLALMVVPLILLIVWTAMGGLEAELVVVDADDLSQNYYECYADTKAKVFVGILLAYGGILLLVTAVMAFLVRNVQYVMYNESKYLALSVYTLLFTGVIVIALQASGAVDREAMFVLRSLLIIGCILLAILFLFAPKVYYQLQKVDKYSLSNRTTNESIYTSRRQAGKMPTVTSPQSTSSNTDQTTTATTMV
mmetsp:Transcript_2222/g.7051  ORF Transcript_2222/g.7051 Transcript_2222/m.7051 type:complete len:761 (+) Transcript_2222:83-2365(+)